MCIRDRYNLPFSVTLDYNHTVEEPGEYTQLYQPVVTPEVFIELNGEIIYRGMIDNSYQELGQWSLPTEHYLVDVLASIMNGDSLVYLENQAVGCFINY